MTTERFTVIEPAGDYRESFSATSEANAAAEYASGCHIDDYAFGDHDLETIELNIIVERAEDGTQTPYLITMTRNGIAQVERS